jgi:hypothetical protein
MKKLLLLLCVGRVAFAASTQATFVIKGELASAINIVVQPQNIDNNPAAGMNASLDGAVTPQLATSLNLLMQCVGSVELKMYVNSVNNFKLITTNGAQSIAVPYQVKVNGGNPFDTPSASYFTCDSQSKVIPIEVKSNYVPSNYSTGAYQDKLLFIVTY